MAQASHYALSVPSRSGCNMNSGEDSMTVAIHYHMADRTTASPVDLALSTLLSTTSLESRFSLTVRAACGACGISMLL